MKWEISRWKNGPNGDFLNSDTEFGQFDNEENSYKNYQNDLEKFYAIWHIYNSQ